MAPALSRRPVTVRKMALAGGTMGVEVPGGGDSTLASLAVPRWRVSSPTLVLAAIAPLVVMNGPAVAYAGTLDRTTRFLNVSNASSPPTSVPGLTTPTSVPGVARTAPATATAGTTTTTPKAMTPGAPRSTTTTTSPAIAASRLLAGCIAAANAEPALEWRGTMTGKGSELAEVTVAGRVDGTQTVTGTRAGGRLSVNIVLIGQKAYVLGNPNGLRALVGLKATAATKEAGKWFVVPASEQQLFGNLAAGLTVSSATQQLDLMGALRFLPETTLAGTAVVGIETATLATGTPGTEMVYMRASGVPLPVEAVQRSQGVADVITFSHWGVAPVATVPSSAGRFAKSWLP